MAKRKYNIERDTIHTNTIRIERAKKKISQRQLAKILGISRISMVKIENNINKPSTATVLKMAQYFGTTVEKLFTIIKW